MVVNARRLSLEGSVAQGPDNSGAIEYPLDMKREFDVIIERDSDGYFVASVPMLPGCHTQARSLDALQDRIREAILLCIEEYGMDENPPEFVAVQRVAVEA